MTTGILDTVKKAATEAVESSKPVNMVFGTVTAVNPVEVMVTPSLTLKEGDGVLKLARQVTDYETTITVIDWYTENMSGGSGDASFASHNHPLVGEKKVIINNALEVNDKVIMARVQGGQQYIVLDKVGE